VYYLNIINVTSDMEDEVVKKSLFEFLQDRVNGIKLEDIDEIVLAYVVSILQDLASNYSEGDEESLDVDAFYEMLTAYMPDTNSIQPAEVSEWMFGLVQAQKEAEDHYNSTKFSHIDLNSLIEQSTRVTKERTNSTGSSGSSRTTKDNSECADSSLEKKRTARFSENSDEDGYDGEEYQQMMNQLLEMFPYACDLEVNHCLTITNGELERASQLIMHRHEGGQSLQPTDRRMFIRNHSKNSEMDDKSVKQLIVGKYGFVDQAEDGRYHRPIIKKDDDKKMVRYRDGKIVNTKGERFTQVTKAESDEMKKSYKF